MESDRSLWEVRVTVACSPSHLQLEQGDPEWPRRPAEMYLCLTLSRDLGEATGKGMEVVLSLCFWRRLEVGHKVKFLAQNCHIFWQCKQLQ